MKRRYVTLDVFTDRRFAGNPLAVVLEAEGLGTEQMQTVANEFNLPETVFVLPAEDKKHRARCRIFTPKRELPFAGHPTVGTAVLLATLDGGKAGEFVLEEKIGLIRCRVKAREGGGEASFVLPSMPSEVTAPPPNTTIAAALGLDVADIGAGDLAPSCWSAGNPFLFVPLGSIDAVRRASPDLAAFRALAPTFPESAITKPFPFNAYYDLDDAPDISAADWKLEVRGLVDNKKSWTLQELYTLPQVTQITRHICVEGWSAIGSWTGTPLRDFLKLIGADTRAQYVWFKCADKDGYNSPLDMRSALHPQTQMTFKYANEILPRAYGFPMKIRIPTKLSFKNPKYVVAMEVTNTDKGGYWENQGYNWFAGL